MGGKAKYTSKTVLNEIAKRKKDFNGITDVIYFIDTGCPVVFDTSYKIRTVRGKGSSYISPIDQILALHDVFTCTIQIEVAVVG